MSNILFLLTYAFEASIRKYLFSSYILIFVKYIFLFKIKFTKAIFSYSLILFCLTVPLIILLSPRFTTNFSEAMGPDPTDRYARAASTGTPN